jgi:hypothetical protein
MARIIKLSSLPEKKKISQKMRRIRKLLLTGPVMTPDQIKEYEKRFPWLKKIKD